MVANALVLGAVAYDPKVVTIWELIRDWYRDRGQALDYVLFGSYEQQVEALLARHIEIAWNTNVAWLRLQKRCEGRARALAMRDADLDFLTVLVARADTKITTLAELRGRTVALGSADSSQAAILPVHWLREAGLAEGKDYRSLRFDKDVGKHGDTGSSELDVLAAVGSRQADAGFVGMSTWARLLVEGRIDGTRLASVWTSPGFHHCNFSVLPDFPAERERAFLAPLFAMTYDDPRARHIMDLEGLKAWVPGRVEGYASLQAAMQQQGLR